MFKVKLYADGADKKLIFKINKNKLCSGFTTNPTLMRKDGVKDYKKFAKNILNKIKNKPVSFECFADNFNEIEKQARIIQSWSKNAYVKIPVTNTKGINCYKTISKLSKENINLNITAVFTYDQCKKIVHSISKSNKSCKIIISVFAGRIADTGRDPIPILKKCVNLIKKTNFKNLELLWASPREVLNIYQADELGVDIITVPYSFFEKIKLKNKDLNKYSIETVKMFYNDALKSRYKI